ncbi:MAG TPA: hypothetical protein VFR20_01560 [Burkholderiaceae bacterium]|nr:hypothetical protein [Burkholderiaceae bacterium]
MNDEVPPEAAKGPSLLTLTHVIYALFALGIVSVFFLGAGAVAALIVAYLKRADAAGTVYAPHFDWVIRTFWWGLLWMVISFVLTLIFIGWITGAIAIIWLIYRIAKGWLALLSGYAPSSNY